MPVDSSATDNGTDVPAAVYAATAAVLSTLQSWLAEPSLSASRLVIACAAEDDGSVAALVSAAVRGLIRSARTEYPRQIGLLVVPNDQTLAPELLAAALHALRDEPEIVIADGELQVPRLTHARSETAADESSEPTPARLPDPNGTVLITGGTGTLGALVASHLVANGARHLLLTSRRGEQSPGAADLMSELSAQGAQVTIAACDAADRSALADVLAGIPADHPLTSVVHCAGITEDASISSLSPERLAAVLRPKIDAAWHLHELTQDSTTLTEFVLFSSASGTLGNAGQANYAAANAALDALARHRIAHGLPARSLAWGPWAERSTLTAALTTAGRARIERSGVGELDTADALNLFDTARSTTYVDPVLVALHLDPATLRNRLSAGELPPILRHLAGAPATRATSAPTPSLRTSATVSAPAEAYAQELRAMAEPDRRRALLDLVRSHAAVVLGERSAADIEPHQGFMDRGFDSVSNLALRERLFQATGISLPSTLIFDYPTAGILADHLTARLGTRVRSGTAVAPALAEVDRLELFLASFAADAAAEARVTVGRRLRDLASRWPVGDGLYTDPAADLAGPSPEPAPDLAEASDDDLFAFVRQLRSADGPTTSDQQK